MRGTPRAKSTSAKFLAWRRNRASGMSPAGVSPRGIRKMTRLMRFAVPRRPKKINGVAKSPENPANPADRRLGLCIDSTAQRLVHGRGILEVNQQIPHFSKCPC